MAKGCRRCRESTRTKHIRRRDRRVGQVSQFAGSAQDDLQGSRQSHDANIRVD